MTALLRPVPDAAIPAAQDEQQIFACAVAEANTILNAQRDALVELGLAVDDSGFAAETARQFPGLREASGAHRIRLLQLSLGEINARQGQILAAVRTIKRAEFESIALDAFVHATHRIRTCLDVALGCSEEVAEIAAMADKKEIVHAARESAMSLRLIYHYTNELSDLASFKTIAVSDPSRAFDCGTALQNTVAALQPIAADLGVALHVEPCAGAMMEGQEKILLRTLTYLVLTSIVAPGVKNVLCSVEQVEDDSKPQIRFKIVDNGPGLTLEDRISSGTCNAMLGAAPGANASDATGFAVVRRLSRILGGRIVIELAKGQGSRMLLTIPKGEGAGGERRRGGVLLATEQSAVQG